MAATGSRVASSVISRYIPHVNTSERVPQGVNEIIKGSKEETPKVQWC